ncbi:hypothetical protein [Sporisorium scitamineum]|uniref:Transcription regulator Rua1 C-terminal domain-containing protein n=1 Tax=Sporisorium scitamineum TaxID=49012 RepID=A0A0F7RUX4_9BASI|nr:hypothetical protein [Sporisorium scitamineum]
MSYQRDPCSPESAKAPVLRQAIRGSHRDPSPSHRSEHVYVDPKSALDHFTCAPFGYGMLGNSSQNSYHGQGEHFENFEASANTLTGLGFSSCDEDADGEADQSYTSQHSFWANHPGDTSASTVNTVDFDDTPVPLLGRDGSWKGGTPPSKVASCRDLQKQDQRYGSSSRVDHSLYQADRVEDPPAPRSAPYQGTRLRRAAAETDGRAEHSFGSTETQRDNLQQGGSTSSSSAKKAKRTSKKLSRRPNSSNKVKSSRTLSSDDNRQASSEIGSSSSARPLSSPASSLGRYRLRRKESVPVLSLAELLTPPPNEPASSSDEAVHGSPDWHDEDNGEALGQLRSNYETRLRGKKHVQVKPDEDEEEKAAQYGVHDSGGSGEFDLEQADPCNGIPKTDAEEAVKDEPEETFLPEPSRNRGTRTFPGNWEIHPDFPLLYQRYSVPSSVSPEVFEMLLRHLNFSDVDEHFREIVDRAQRSYGAFNRPRSILDLYTPRFVKATRMVKSSFSRLNFRLFEIFRSTPAYNYHLQNFHGVSASTGLPFTPPTHFRGKRRTNVKPTERAQIIQGLCHCCHKYIDMQGPKGTEIRVPEIYWWKHAQACHRKGKTPEGVGGYFVEDTWFERVCTVLELIDGYDSEISKLLSDNK